MKFMASSYTCLFNSHNCVGQIPNVQTAFISLFLEDNDIVRGS